MAIVGEWPNRTARSSSLFFSQQLEDEWEGLKLDPVVPNEKAVKAVQSEKQDAEEKELRESGSRPEAIAIDGEKDVEEHELMALALDGGRKIHDPYPYQANPGASGSAVADRLRAAAAAEEKSKPPLVEPVRAPAKAEAAAAQGPPDDDEDEETRRWY